MRLLVQWWLMRARGEGRDGPRRARDGRHAGRVGEGHDGVRVGDVERAADERHPEGRVEARREGRPRLGRAVAVGVTEERDAVGAGHARAGLLHEQPHEEALDALAVVGLGRRVGLGDEHVAVGQHGQPAGVVQAGREGRHGHAGRGRRHRAGGPPDGVGDVDGRDERAVRSGQLGAGPGAGGDGQRADEPHAPSASASAAVPRRRGATRHDGVQKGRRSTLPAARKSPRAARAR